MAKNDTESPGDKRPHGAPKGSMNAATTGLKMVLTSGRLPKGCSYIKTAVGKLRKALEREIIEREGELSLYAAAVCQSASRHECRVLLCQRWLATQDALTPDQKLALLKESGNATRARDAALRELGLHQRASDRLAAKLYDVPAEDEKSSENDLLATEGD